MERNDIIKAMKKLIILTLFLSLIFVFAHTDDTLLSQEIEKGKGIVEKSQKGEVKCTDLKDEDFHSVGEYVMDLMVGGDDHLRMNEIIKQMHGEKGEELIHINMGKRFLGCDGNQTGFMPMMRRGYWMMGGWGMPMMNSWKGWNYISPFLGTMSLIYAFVILVIPILLFIILFLGVLYLYKKVRNGKTNSRGE